MNHPPLSHLLHPELFHSMPVIGSVVASALDGRAEASLRDNPTDDPPISVVIRARNEAPQLKGLLQDISRQIIGNEVEIVVVDNESTDDTRDVADTYGAKIVTLPKDDFTYPLSMNLGGEAASHDVVFLTVAHAQLSTDTVLHAAARHFKHGSKVAGVFGGRVALPGSSASPSDIFSSMLNSYVLMRKPVSYKKAGLGVMGAVGIMMSRPLWHKLGRFDESRETGGEDTILARKMLAAGYGILRDPGTLIHHSHGLNAITNLKEAIHCAKTLRGPQKLTGEVGRRRRARFGE